MNNMQFDTLNNSELVIVKVLKMSVQCKKMKQSLAVLWTSMWALRVTLNNKHNSKSVRNVYADVKLKIVIFSPLCHSKHAKLFLPWNVKGEVLQNIQCNVKKKLSRKAIEIYNLVCRIIYRKHYTVQNVAASKIFLMLFNTFIPQRHIKLVKKTVKTIIMLQKISVSNKCCCFILH